MIPSIKTTSALWIRQREISPPSSGLEGKYKYTDAVAVGNKIYMIPFNVDDVGVLDVETGSFSAIVSAGTTSMGIRSSLTARFT